MERSKTEETEEVPMQTIEEPGRRTEMRPLKRKGKKIATCAFKSVTRNDCFVQKYYYGPQNVPAPGHYRPDYSKIKIKNLALKFPDPTMTIPRP